MAPNGLTSTLSIPAKWIRAITYSQFTPSSHLAQKWIKIPPIGTLFLTFGYLAFILILEFINGTSGLQFWQQRGVRAGWLAIAQMPILILLIAKLNWITLFTGVSYERLNVLHRWASYIMMLM